MKITFVTYHNWKTKRQGGFHKFAEASVNAGYETVFFSFSRPFFGIFKNSEILNYKVLLKLIFGKKYYNDFGNSIINFTWPTFALPNPIAKFLNDNQVVFFKNISIFPFILYCKIFLQRTDVFVFESCDGLLLYDKIKKYFPNSKIIYRPSDPIQLTSDNKVIKELEKKIISEANLVMIVNNESKTLYSSIMNEFNNSKHIILPNGISINKFKLKHDTPIEMSKHKNRVTYVGAREPNWNLIIQSAKKLKDFNFFIVTPIIPNIKIKNQIECLTNVFFIPGIFPHEVPN